MESNLLSLVIHQKKRVHGVFWLSETNGKFVPRFPPFHESGEMRSDCSRKARMVCIKTTPPGRERTTFICAGGFRQDSHASRTHIPLEVGHVCIYIHAYIHTCTPVRAHTSIVRTWLHRISVPFFSFRIFAKRFVIAFEKKNGLSGR